MADIIVINKADGDNLARANLAKAQYKNALHLFPPSQAGWQPLVLTCSSLEKTGIDRIWEIILDYKKQTTDNGYFQRKRNEQNIQLMFNTINETLKEEFYADKDIGQMLHSIKSEVLNNKISSYIAAQKLIDAYLKNCN